MRATRRGVPRNSGRPGSWPNTESKARVSNFTFSYWAGSAWERKEELLACSLSWGAGRSSGMTSMISWVIGAPPEPSVAEGDAEAGQGQRAEEKAEVP